MTGTTFQALMAGVNLHVMTIIVLIAVSFLLGGSIVIFINGSNSKALEIIQDSPDSTDPAKRPLSYSRVTGFMLVVSYICWGSYIVFTKYNIPDFPVWLAAFLAALYGFNTTDIKIGK